MNADLIYDIWLSDAVDKKYNFYKSLVDAYGSAKNVYDEKGSYSVPLTPGTIRRLSNKSLESANIIFKRCERQHIEILSVNDEKYPARLREIYDPPIILYAIGTLPDFDNLLCIAGVGKRECSEYGRENARRICKDLSETGIIIVSGLAKGIDSACHKGALDAGGITVAVFGTAIDKIYPAIQKPLRNKIVVNGAVISEYGPGVKTEKSSFPQRNRIICGLCQGVAVFEAPEKSGSLITASYAAEYNRDIFAMPGNIDHPNFVGCNSLIKNDLATPILGAESIINDYIGMFPELGNAAKSKKQSIGLSEEDRAALTEFESAVIEVLGSDARSIDEIIRGTKLPANKVISAVGMLKVKRIITDLPGNRYKRS